MAAGGFRTFVAGETLDEDKINDFLMQGILVFADAAARDAAITTPVEGQFAFLNDSDSLTYYSGTAWEELSTEPGVAVVSGTTGSPTISTDGSATVYKFTGSGSITFSDAGLVDLLIVGGGGGGAFRGGGGGGGLVFRQDIFVPAETVTVTVGAGGAANTSETSNTLLTTGLDSRMFTTSTFDIVGVGGGGGGNFGNGGLAGGKGGSGGGSSSQNAVSGGGLNVAGQGQRGNFNTSAGSGGGGGGAGETGLQNTSNGNDGLANSITGSSVTYSAGGAGNGGSPGAGGGGGANTGSGGNGNTTFGSITAGGSGVVIVRVG